MSPACLSVEPAEPLDVEPAGVLAGAGGVEHDEPQRIEVPGGIEDVIGATSEPAASRTPPPPSDEEPTAEEIECAVAVLPDEAWR